jgi:hypothetical protein
MNEQIFADLLWLSFLSFADVTLTFYQFKLLEKKNVCGPNNELNPLYRMILKKKPTVLKYIFIAILAQTMLYLIVWASGWKEFVIGAICGMLVIANMVHISNLSRMRKKWNDEAYWDKSRFYFNER